MGWKKGEVLPDTSKHANAEFLKKKLINKGFRRETNNNGGRKESGKRDSWKKDSKLH